MSNQKMRLHLYMCDNKGHHPVNADNTNGWKTEIGTERENSKFNSIPPGVGAFSQTSSSIGDDEIPISGRIRTEKNISSLDDRTPSVGGIARQLINKVQIQLAYHEKQASELKVTLDELFEFVDALEIEELEESGQLQAPD